jgi:aminoglycoside 3-N-acetyltransferase
VEKSQPATIRSLSSDLRALGVRPGDVLLVHSSARSLGFVVGGAQAVVQALLDVLGPDGTLVVPAHTSQNSDPARWSNPPVPASWWLAIRDQAPGFDPARTPSQWMGIIAETTRTWPGALRSNHPQVSFAALGRLAAEITGTHQLDDALGEHSPLGAVYRLGGKVLLLGCGYDSNTSLHLAEWRQESPRGIQGASVRLPDGSSQWVTWTDVLDSTDDFEELGDDFEAGFEGTAGPAAGLSVGRVAKAPARLMPQRALVDFAQTWMATHRTPA